MAITNDSLSDHYVAVAEEMLDYYAPNGVSDEDLLSLLSLTVLNQPLDPQTSDYLLPLLGDETISQAELVAYAAMSDENTSQYADDIQLTGFVYSPDVHIAAS